MPGFFILPLLKLKAMINTPQLQQAFRGLVGFRQPDDPVYMKIAQSLTVSSSGKYVQGSHPLAALENIQNIAPEFAGFSYPVYSAGSTYAEGTIVQYSSALYKAIEDVPINTDPTNVAYWKKTDPYSDWIQRLYDGAVSQLATDLTTVKTLTNAGKSLLDSQRLYNGFGGYNDRIIKKGRFVGLEIAIVRAEQIGIALNQVGFQCDGPATINFYLYHSSQIEAISLIPVAVDTGGNFQWTDVSNVMMGYLSKNYDSTGLFYLGYYEDDLPVNVQAISRVMDFGRAPCAQCGTYNIDAFNSWSKYIKIGTFEVAAQWINVDRELFDPLYISYAPGTNYGINLGITVGCDLTPFFIQHKEEFADGLTSRIIVNILNEIAFNTRSNAISDKIKKLALADLDPNKKSGSFYSQYLAQLQALNINFSGFNASCLPVHDNGRRLSYGSI